ncbi:MAG: hypothetical protein GC202_06220 [Alphaproteobacteria bacterium]|nr:hypothetical protein [Alphaproteobacteria bacterium]
MSRILGVRVGTPVHLSYENFSKITLTHKDITFAEFARLREAILSPASFISKGRLRSAEITFVDAQRPLRIILRATRRNEIYVISIYRLRMSEVRRLYKRARREKRIVRDLKTELARQVLPRQ